MRVARQRPRELRSSAKEYHGRHPDRRFSLRTEQSRRRSGARVQRNARRIFARQSRERLQCAGADLMNDRAFRLDFFIAIAAVLISALTAGTLISTAAIAMKK